MASKTRQARNFVGAGLAAGLGWKVGTGLLPVLGVWLLGLLLWLTVQLESVQEALVVEGLLIGGVVALLRWRREMAGRLRHLLNPRIPGSRLPRGWTGELFYVYRWWWPQEHLLPTELQGRGLGGRQAYIGRSVDVARRTEDHVRDGREFVLPYGRQEVFRVPTHSEMVELERRLIREADAAGEPIVNVQLYRRPA